MATEIGTRIRRARERKRWSQQELAGALGVDRKTVDNWENGRTRPRSSIGAIEEVLGVRLDDDADQRPALSPTLLREIMNTEGLTLEQRQALIRDIEAMLARERGHTGDASGAGPWKEAPGSDAGDRRRRPAS